MATNTFEAFYLGVFSDLDPNEGNFQAENSGSLVGQTFGGSAAPLYDSIDSLTTDDANNDGGILENDTGQVGEDLVFGGVASTLDSVIEYNVTLTYIDGTTATTQIMLLQDESGRVFLAPFSTGSGNNTALSAKPIESISLDSVSADNYSGLLANTEQDAFIDGAVDGTAGDDNMGTTYTDADGTQMNAYGGNDTVDAGAGNDTVNSGNNNDVVYGGEGNDSIDSGSGTDTVYGGEGNDTIDSGTGADVVYGGAGDDLITDNVGGAGSHDTVDGGSGNDTIEGGSGDDLIFGGIGADSIDGGANNDVVEGGEGNDTIFGGDGADTIIGDSNLGAGQTEYIAQGFLKGENFTLTNDHFNSAGATEFTIDGAPVEIRFVDNDAISDGDAATQEIADDADQMIEINGVLYNFSADFQETFTGSDGNTYEFLIVDVDLNQDGTFDNYTVFGDHATDPDGDLAYEDGYLLIPVGTPPAPGVDLTATGTTTPFTSIPYASLYGARATTYADSIDGGAGDDSIYGGTGQDTLYGGTGDDYLDGGADRDQFVVEDGFGNDTIVGGETGTDSDTILLNNVTTGGVTVTFTDAETGTITDGADTISFSEIENLSGTNQGDYFDLSARTDDNSYIFSLGGDDTLIGGSGQDDLRAGDGNDYIDGGDGGGNLEGGSGNDTVIGGSGNEDIYGGIGDDLIYAEAGDDVIYAGTGADTIIAGTGDDNIELGSDSDRDILILEDAFSTIGGTDYVWDFDLTDSGDGTTVDQLDVSDLHDANGNAVNTWDVVVSDTNGNGTGHAILTFPNGESVTLFGVTPAQVDNASKLNSIGIPCFTPGTMIKTPNGETPVEELALGDMVTTLEHGHMPIRWAARSDISYQNAPLPEQYVPVRIKPGILGNQRALVVSPQHCILMANHDASRTFYVRAKHLAEETSLASFARRRNTVSYVHILLDQHATLISNNIPSESFYPGPYAVENLSALNRMRLFALIPDLASQPVATAYGARAAPTLTRSQLRKCVASGTLAGAVPALPELSEL
ncbi:MULTISPECIES: Hint domain-containing protein [Phaeobacter]|uniref:Hint domain-containing protein n=1 Tax=Phaeobacter TaxID=302485 RepID=UPI003A8B198E